MQMDKSLKRYRSLDAVKATPTGLGTSSSADTRCRYMRTLTVPFISRQDLLTAKIAASRPQDLADVAALRDSSRSDET
ncbi:MAG TPA: hypothetical protein VHX52_06255 [Steroidobacteraceae bacterium]|jgi:hypothetical protein|nr:hypothetical protein [Steroidobacteraceae bacterium]